jgi:polar amino acid transport system permease protein
MAEQFESPIGVAGEVLAVIVLALGAIVLAALNKWYLGPLGKYAKFSGRANRKECWLFVLWNLAIMVPLVLINPILFMLYYLGVLLPSLAVGARRLHDTNRSAWWLLLSIVPLAHIALLVFSCLKGTDGDNDYGPDPLISGGRITDERPWWDTFPFWSLIIVSVLVWMGWQILTNDDYELAWERIIPGLGLTVYATILAFTIALVLALLVGIGQMSRYVAFRTMSRTYVEFVRGIPILPLIFTVALIIVPLGTDAINGPLERWFGWELKLSWMWRAIVTLSVIYGAYMAEIFRGGIQSVPPGQTEAGRSLGLNRRQTMNSVVLPQAMRAIIPPLGNDFIAILKDTSLLSVLGVLEITQRARQFSASTFKFREGYFVLAFIYLLLTLGLSLLLGMLERRMTRDRKGER